MNERQDSEERWTNWKLTSCMCHREACHRALWAHLAQNSIPTWKSDIPNWIYHPKFTKNSPNSELKSNSKLNWNHNQLKGWLLTAAPTDRANVPNISDQGTSPPYTNQTQFHYKIIFICKSSSINHAWHQCQDIKNKVLKNDPQNKSQVFVVSVIPIVAASPAFVYNFLWYPRSQLWSYQQHLFITATKPRPEPFF